MDDFSGVVTEAWTGPQVAWKMARGEPGAFGGKKINSLAGLARLLRRLPARARRPAPAALSLRNLDLLALLSFSVSLWYFNHGHDLHERPARLPARSLYLLGRTLWIGVRGAAAARLAPGLAGLAARRRDGLPRRLPGRPERPRLERDRRRLRGRDRRRADLDGQSPYGHFPVEDDLKPCGPADREGEIRDRIQTNGRCESANPHGDTYGPVAYLTYLPGYCDLRLDRASGTTCPRRTSPRSPSTCSACSGSASSAGASAATGSG